MPPRAEVGLEGRRSKSASRSGGGAARGLTRSLAADVDDFERETGGGFGIPLDGGGVGEFTSPVEASVGLKDGSWCACGSVDAAAC